jgi:hypothetical protein
MPTDESRAQRDLDARTTDAEARGVGLRLRFIRGETVAF